MRSTRSDRYLIGKAAELLGMHPQTLRKYERLGLIRPARLVGSVRVYSTAEIDRLRLIKTLVDGAGINLAGVQRLLEIHEVVVRIRPLARIRSGSLSRGDVAKSMREEIDNLCRLLGVADR